MTRSRLSIVLGAALLTSPPGGELTWTMRADLPRPVAGYMGVEIEEKLIVAGGSYWVEGKKHWTAQVQIFDPQKNVWSEGVPMPEPRSDAAAATLDGVFYTFGGGSDTEVRRDALSFHGRRWQRIPAAALPEPRLYAVAIACRDSIYVVGGLSRPQDYTTVTDTFWRWRPGEAGWEVLPRLPGPGRISHAVAEIGGKIYVFGGATTAPAGVRNLADAYSFDPSTRTWTRLPELPLAVRAWWAVGLRDGALLLGGYSDDFLGRVWKYDLTGGMRDAGSLPHALADAKFFRVREILVGAGGESGLRIRSRSTLQTHVPPIWLPLRPPSHARPRKSGAASSGVLP
jgi:N-acetylneuraminic acid mutarotase